MAKTYELTVKIKWWHKALLPIWFIQVGLGFKPWVPKRLLSYYINGQKV